MSASISILTRVRHHDLYRRMLDTAAETAVKRYGVLMEPNDGQPRLAESYNRMAKKAKADILVLCHDDAVFLTPGWDDVLREAFKDEYLNVVGVVGSRNYKGGTTFWPGYPDCLGAYVSQVGDEMRVKLVSGHEHVTPCSVVDSFFMAVRRTALLLNPFDEALDGMFFYDIDFMLRVGGVAISPILMGHHKPKSLYGVYPPGMKPISAYWDYFHKKHGLNPGEMGESPSYVIAPGTLAAVGRMKAYNQFVEKITVEL